MRFTHGGRAGQAVAQQSGEVGDGSVDGHGAGPVARVLRELATRDNTRHPPEYVLTCAWEALRANGDAKSLIAGTPTLIRGDEGSAIDPGGRRRGPRTSRVIVQGEAVFQGPGRARGAIWSSPCAPAARPSHG